MLVNNKNLNLFEQDKKHFTVPNLHHFNYFLALLILLFDVYLTTKRIFTRKYHGHMLTNHFLYDQGVSLLSLLFNMINKYFSSCIFHGQTHTHMY